jgi:hypothetical protein
MSPFTPFKRPFLQKNLKYQSTRRIVSMALILLLFLKQHLGPFFEKIKGI